MFTIGLFFAALVGLSYLAPSRFGVVAIVAWIPGWLASELPIHLLLIEAGLVGLAVIGGGLDDTLGWIGLGLALAAAAGLVHHVRLALRTRSLVEVALARGLGDDHEARAAATPEHRPSMIRHGWMSLAAIWPKRPRAVERIRDVCYYRNGRKQLCLDVFRPRDVERRRAAAPVLLYIHGGGWMIGSKGQQGRMLKHAVAEAGWICVSISYSLSPHATFPDHLLDVKRAIGWVRQNIRTYGGDPSFIVLAGGSAGAHLASLAALTPNDPEYQPELPGVDTEVQGCVAFYGVFDFADRDRAFRFRAFRSLLIERIVMKQSFADAPEEFDKASPRWRAGAHAPPFMVVHGTRDTLAPLAAARAFAEELYEVTHEPVVWLELPGAHHMFETFPSVRSAAVTIGVEQFCATIHADWRRVSGQAA
jgi:acetyl esterase/lipase